jgi:hypothetical protein
MHSTQGQIVAIVMLIIFLTGTIVDQVEGKHQRKENERKDQG